MLYNPQLETFIKVADKGSFAKAADDLFISPPAVIKQINLLERDLNLRLFIRTHRGLNLTPAGNSLYNDAKYLIDYAKASATRAKEAMQMANSAIRVGTSPLTPTKFLMDLSPKIQKQYPQINFQLIPFENTPENAREILQNLGKDIDIVAGIYDKKFLQQRKCSALKLFMTPFCIAVPFHHKLAVKKELAINDLFGENLMIIHRGWNTYIDEIRDDIMVKYPKINIVDFYKLAVFNQCENNNYLLLVIENFINVHPLLKLIPVKWNYAAPFGLLHAKNPTPNVQIMLQAVKNIL